MTDYERGIEFGLALAVSIGHTMKKSPAFFIHYEEWVGYKRATKEYQRLIMDAMKDS